MVDLVSLRDCPPGLFRFGETIGFKTEYRGMETVGPIEVPGDQVRWIVGNHSDAYVVESGESFWGGAPSRDARDALMVEPVAVSSLPCKSGEGADHVPVPATNQAGEVADKANHDCLAKRRPGEPMFILLGRDPDAWQIVQAWANRRLAAGGDPHHVALGLKTANAMRDYAADPANCPASAPPADAYPALATQPATSQEGEKPNRWYADAPKNIWLHGIGGGHETTWADDPSPTGDAEEEAHAVGYVRDDLAATPTPPTLSEDLRTLVEALEPFAAACNITTAEDSESLYDSLAAEKLTWRDLRRARSALAQVKAS